MSRVAKWLKPKGLLFVHIFVTNSLPYHFEVKTCAHISDVWRILE